MRIEMAADHRGFGLKARLAAWLAARGVAVRDWGCASEAACDYPDFAYAAARAVATTPQSRGIVICSNGVGVTMVANKVPGVRAALCHTPAMATQARRHNDANVLALGADDAPFEEQCAIVQAWLETEFEGGRHARRVAKIMAGECRAPAVVEEGGRRE